MNGAPKKWRQPPLALLVLLAAWALFGLSKPDTQHFRVDEAEYLAMGVASLNQLLGETDASLGGQLSEPIQAPWRDGFHATTFGFQSPGLTKWLFGLVARSSGIRKVDAAVWPRFVSKRYSRDEFKARRQAAKKKLSKALGPARQTTRLLAALITGLLFTVAHRIASQWPAPSWAAACAGTLSATLWVASPATLEAAHYVRPGLLPIFFWCLALLLSLMARPYARQLPLALALGLLVGLATAGKLNGILLAPLVPVFLFLHGARRIQLALITLLAAAFSFAVFVALNPGLWHDPFNGVTQILAAWRGDLAHQADLVPTGVLVPTSRFDALTLALKGVATYAGPLAAQVPYLGALLGWAGLAALAKKASTSTSDRIALAWCLILLIGSGFMLPIERLRYLTPLVAPFALAGGLLVAHLAIQTRARWFRESPARDYD